MSMVVRIVVRMVASSVVLWAWVEGGGGVWADAMVGGRLRCVSLFGSWAGDGNRSGGNYSSLDGGSVCI